MKFIALEFHVKNCKISCLWRVYSAQLIVLRIFTWKCSHSDLMMKWCKLMIMLMIGFKNYCNFTFIILILIYMYFTSFAAPFDQTVPQSNWWGGYHRNTGEIFKKLLRNGLVHTCGHFNGIEIEEKQSPIDAIHALLSKKQSILAIYFEWSNL